jgi:hypothetical protein
LSNNDHLSGFSACRSQGPCGAADRRRQPIPAIGAPVTTSPASAPERDGIADIRLEAERCIDPSAFTSEGREADANGTSLYAGKRGVLSMLKRLEASLL